MTKKDITIDGIQYTPVVKASPTTRKIIVTRDRWNIVANVTRAVNELVLTDAAVIRYWGTSKGLGELAIDGPTAKTVLDPLPKTRVAVDNVLFMLDVSSSL